MVVNWSPEVEEKLKIDGDVGLLIVPGLRSPDDAAA